MNIDNLEKLKTNTTGTLVLSQKENEKSRKIYSQISQRTKLTGSKLGDAKSFITKRSERVDTQEDAVEGEQVENGGDKELNINEDGIEDELNEDEQPDNNVASDDDEKQDEEE